MDLKIQAAKVAIFRNNEHFQFHTEFRDLVMATTNVRNKILTPFADYLTCYSEEDIALQKIVKSATTEQIDDADKVRDPTFRGMVNINKAALNHFDPDVVVAAKRLQIVFDTYGNVNRMPLNEQTSAVNNLVHDLETAYAAEVLKVGINNWLAMLKAQNAAFAALVKSRNDENASRTELKMKQTRALTDQAYNTIVKRLNALVIVEGPTIYEGFIKKLNSFIEKYNNILAQRQGRSKAKSNKAEATATATGATVAGTATAGTTETTDTAE